MRGNAPPSAAPALDGARRPLDFGMLGAVEIRAGHEVLELRRSKQLALLATVLLSANKVVSTGRLIDAIWGEDPPASAPALVQNYVSALRRLIEQHGHPGTILTRPPGYLIRVGPEALDLHRFELLVAQARGASEQGDGPLAAKLLRAALHQWRGPALDGLVTPVLRAAAVRLDELRLTALEDRIAVDVQLGPVEPVAAELRELVDTHPLRERLRAQLMRVLYQLGRQGEAFEVFRRGCAVLSDELGVDPGPDLRSAYQAILEADSAPVRAEQAVVLTGPPVPGLKPPDQFPPAPTSLLGRDQETRLLTGALRAAAQQRGAVLCAISGMAGSGKSALALHIGNAVKDAFPDGRLFVPLHGTERTTTTRDALAMMLRSIGVPATDLPDSVDERAALLRSTLAGRQMLVIVDDAPSEAQARPLLAALPGCAVLVTSRRLLAALDWQVHVDLGPLRREDSERLLLELLGSERAGGDPAVASIAQLCGDLPLALRAAAARLVARPRWSLATYAAILRDGARRLNELSIGDLDVRASIARSHRELDAEEAAALHWLGRLGHTKFRANWLAVVLRLPMQRGEQLAERLVDARLLEPESTCGGDWYQIPELVRVFAGERALAEGPVPENPPEPYAALAVAGRYTGRCTPPRRSVRCRRSCP